MSDEVRSAEPNLATNSINAVMISPPVETDVACSSLLSPRKLSTNDSSLKTHNDENEINENVVEYYKMDHKKRGYAVIFGHQYFDDPNLPQLVGTEVDCEKLEEALHYLGFTVSVKKDLTKIKLLDTVEEYANMDHKDCDCFVICVMSHGDSETGLLYAKDTTYCHSEIWDWFSAEKCPKLAEKPKLFFFDACRGNKSDSGVTRNIQVDSSGPSYRIPSFSDFLMSYSSAEGYLSWYDTREGSWFTQTLAKVLTDYGFKYDLLTLLTLVNQRVAYDFPTNVSGKKEEHLQKQMPATTHMLTRLVKFCPSPPQ